MRRVLFGIGATLFGVLVCEKIYTRGFNDGVDKCANTIKAGLELVEAVTEKEEEKES